MSLLPRIRSLLEGLLRRRQVEESMQVELQFHVNAYVEDLVRSGLSRAEARRRAQIEFGPVEKVREECRQARGLQWFDDLHCDLRYIVRMVRRNPGFTAVAVITLALGIGANTAIFSLLNALVLRDLPVLHPEQLVRFGVHNPYAFDTSSLWISLPMFREIRREQRVFSTTFAWSNDAVENVDANGALSLDQVAVVTGNFYSELGAVPQLGRLIGPEDVNLKTDEPVQVVVLSYGFWQRYYAGANDVVGKTLKIEGVPFTIIGVTGKGFNGASLDVRSGVTVPLTTEPLINGNSDVRRHLERSDLLWLHADGRLKPGVTLAQAQAELETLWPAVREAVRPSRQTPLERAKFDSLRFAAISGAHGGSLVETRFAQPAYILLTISGLLLLIACVNLATLMLARAASRTHEFGLRVALGAGGSRLMRQMLTETVVLSLAGSMVGVLLADWASHALAQFILSQIFVVPTELRLNPDPRVFIFAVVTAVLTGLLFGLAPAWRAARADPNAALQRGTRVSDGGAGRLGKALIVTQVGLSLVLVTCAGLFLRTLQKLYDVQPGFRTHHLLAMRLAPKPNGYKHLDMSTYYRELTKRLGALPGVESVGFSHMGLGTGFEWTERVRLLSARPRDMSADIGMVMPGFFQTAQIHLLSGRAFTWHDDANAPRVALASTSLAASLFPHSNAIGQRLEIVGRPQWKPVEIIGIVTDASIYDIRKAKPPTLYIPSMQYGDYMSWPFLYVRTDEQPQAMAQVIEANIASLGHEYVPATMVWTVGEMINHSLLRERLIGMLSGYFGALTLLLVAIGLYGLMAYNVTRRTREFGIRLALGAQRRTVLSMILREIFALTFAGITLGLPCAVAAASLIQHMLFGVTSYDALTLTLASITLLVVGSIAGYIPARRAMKIDPTMALRQE